MDEQQKRVFNVIVILILLILICWSAIDSTHTICVKLQKEQKPSLHKGSKCDKIRPSNINKFEVTCKLGLENS